MKNRRFRCVWLSSTLRRVKIRPERWTEMQPTRIDQRCTKRAGEYQDLCRVDGTVGTRGAAASLRTTEKRLEAEGLFDAKHKKRWPVLPSRIGLITSLRASCTRRCAHSCGGDFRMCVLALFPVRVQGEGWPKRSQRRSVFQLQKTVDVLIVDAAGGSWRIFGRSTKKFVARAILNRRFQ